MDMAQMGWLAWIIIGGIAGWLGGIVMRSGGGVLTDIVVGIVGAFIGGFLFNTLGMAGTTGFNFWSLVVALVGAVALLAAIRLLNGHRSIRN